MSGQTFTAVEPPRMLGTLLRAIAFWGVILLPMAALPVLYGTSGTQRSLLFGGIVLLAACCLVVDQTV